MSFSQQLKFPDMLLQPQIDYFPTIGLLTDEIYMLIDSFMCDNRSGRPFPVTIRFHINVLIQIKIVRPASEIETDGNRVERKTKRSKSVAGDWPPPIAETYTHTSVICNCSYGSGFYLNLRMCLYVTSANQTFLLDMFFHCWNVFSIAEMSSSQEVRRRYLKWCTF